MFWRSTSPLARTASGAVLAFVLLLPATESRATEFSSMAGAWTGTGTIAVNNNREKLRCRANYNVSNGGATVDLQIQCASDSTSALSKSPTALSSESTQPPLSRIGRLAIAGAAAVAAAVVHRNCRRDRPARGTQHGHPEPNVK
jgi:hypothetical protein